MNTPDSQTENVIGTPRVENEKGLSPRDGSRRRLKRLPIPQELARQFIHVGHSYYFSGGAHAFEDRGRKLITRSENTELIRSLVAIAKARGWTEITLRGTERFRREAWQNAMLHGLAARGYRPSEVERAKIARILAERSSEKDSSSPPPLKRDPAPRVAKETPRSPLITGELLEHAYASYQFDPKADTSYYIKLKTDEGERTLWGIDLERALKSAKTKPMIGDRVGARAIGRAPVTVKTEGTAISAHRNRWIVEKQEFFDDRTRATETLRDPRIPAPHAVKTHPQLLSSYIALEGADKLANRLFSRPEDREKFVQIVRRRLANVVRSGADLPGAVIPARSGWSRTDTNARKLTPTYDRRAS
jgi:hypothetical protein